MTQDNSRANDPDDAEHATDESTNPGNAKADPGYGSESDSQGTETGAASVNAVYPGSSSGSSGGSTEVTDADVSDMNADRTSEVATGNDVPGVRRG